MLVFGLAAPFCPDTAAGRWWAWLVGNSSSLAGQPMVSRPNCSALSMAAGKENSIQRA